ncbi:MAG TPA: TlpA disulfide reductase family protein [Chloroflexota bacterium]|nr:TlpA disulfide reductase family protein [Chloroflexota bacterium]
MLRRLVIGGVWVGLLGLLALLAWGVFRVSAPDTINAAAGGPARTNWEARAIPLKTRPAPELRVALFPNQDGTLGTAAPAAASGDGARVTRLADLAGRPVVVNFWASWCQPCRDEANVLEQFAQEYGPQGVAFVGVNVWDSDDKARAFLDEFGVSYANGLDAGGSAAIEFGVTGLPETYFVDRQGQLVRKFIGPVTERALRAAVEELLS